MKHEKFTIYIFMTNFKISHVKRKNKGLFEQLFFSEKNVFKKLDQGFYLFFQICYNYFKFKCSFLKKYDYFNFSTKFISNIILFYYYHFFVQKNSCLDAH